MLQVCLALPTYSWNLLLQAEQIWEEVMECPFDPKGFLVLLRTLWCFAETIRSFHVHKMFINTVFDNTLII